MRNAATLSIALAAIALAAFLAACGDDDSAAADASAPGVDATGDPPVDGSSPIDAEPPPSDADLARAITVSFAGTITALDDPDGTLGIAIDDPFEGAYVFDLQAIDSNPDPTVADYTFSAAPAHFRMTVGSVTFVGLDLLIEIVDRPTDDGGDHHLVRTTTNFTNLLGHAVGDFVWQLDDAGGTALASAELTGEPPTLASFTQPFGLTIMGTTDQSNLYFVRGVVSSATAD